MNLIQAEKKVDAFGVQGEILDQSLKTFVLTLVIMLFTATAPSFAGSKDQVKELEITNINNKNEHEVDEEPIEISRSYPFVDKVRYRQLQIDINTTLYVPTSPPKIQDPNYQIPCIVRLFVPEINDYITIKAFGINLSEMKTTKNGMKLIYFYPPVIQKGSEIFRICESSNTSVCVMEIPIQDVLKTPI